MLESMARIHLAAQAWQRLESLPPDVRADVRSTIGFTVTQTDLMAQDGVVDRWHVLGVALEEDDKLKVQRTWLAGRNSGRHALILEFAHSSQPLDTTMRTGLDFDAEAVYFPGSVPQRALLKTREAAVSNPSHPRAGENIQASVASYRSAIAANPWVERFPLHLKDAVPVNSNDRWYVQDESGLLPLPTHYASGWKLASISGGRPIGLFGEWDGQAFRPLTAWSGRRIWPL